MLRSLNDTGRRSSGVERAIGNGEADSSILSGGTIFLITSNHFYILTALMPHYYYA
jgi:hypothetical protein